MTVVSRKTLLLLLGLVVALPLAKSDAPDIRTVKPDLTVPKLESGKAAPGSRVRETLPGYEKTKVYHVTYLPIDWQAGKRYPVIVEYAGNNYRGAHGDISTGRPEGSNMGYGISGGRDFIWVCLPYLNAAGEDITLTWWGDAKNRTAKPTLDYCLKAVPWICEQYGGDPEQIILCGFRGAQSPATTLACTMTEWPGCGGRLFRTAITTALPPGRIPARIATRRDRG